MKQSSAWNRGQTTLQTILRISFFQRIYEDRRTDFTDSDDLQTLFVCSCPTARAVVALIEDSPTKETHRHVHTHLNNANRKCPRHKLTLCQCSRQRLAACYCTPALVYNTSSFIIFTPYWPKKKEQNKAQKQNIYNGTRLASICVKYHNTAWFAHCHDECWVP